MQVVIYVKKGCPYCLKALSLLKQKDVMPEVIDITDQPALRTVMIEKAGGRTTVPQIFIGSRHVGGSDDLEAADKSGKLKDWLAGAD